jgi:ribosome-binding factor A
MQQQETKRQKQVASLLNQELNSIFLRLGLNMMDGGMVSIAKVAITPDLYDARIYLSFFQIKNPEESLQKIKDRAWEIKRELTASVRHQLRSMPILNFYIDDTLDHVFKMEELFERIKQEDQKARESK